MPACPLCASHAGTPLVLSSGRYWHCPTCELVFLDRAQRLSAEAERAYYGTHQNAVDDPGYRRFLATLATPLMARLPRGAQGLDYGAGAAPALAAMLEEAGFPTAIYDPFFADRPALLQRRYDFIACSEVAEHMHDPAAEFARLDRLLRSGGWLGVMTELRPPLEDMARWHYHRDPTHVCLYAEASMHWLAQRFGWQVAHVERRVVLLRKP